MVHCKGCGGTGKMILNDNRGYPCEGCKGTGWVNVADPNALCARCGGTGKIVLQPQGSFDHTFPRQVACFSCKGCGYAR